MKVRYGTSDDAKMLAELGAKTFHATFAKDNRPENMQAHLKNSFSPEIQFAELSTPANIFLIVESEGVSVGYAQLILNSQDESIQGTQPIEIRRIYADPEFIGKGVGKQLMEASINEARQRACDCIWLGVWERNPRAIAFYQKWGFQQVGSHVFQLGDDPQNDLIMELPLS